MKVSSVCLSPTQPHSQYLPSLEMRLSLGSRSKQMCGMRIHTYASLAMNLTMDKGGCEEVSVYLTINIKRDVGEV